MRILITGATDGIGKSTAEALAAGGHDVIIHGRPGESGEPGQKALQAAEEISGRHPDVSVDVVTGNLASLRAVDELAAAVRDRFQDLQCLVLNAGVLTRERRVSEDGYELNLAVNHLAHTLLTIRLIDLLSRNAPARIVVVSSMVHEHGRINWDDINWEKSFNPSGAYGQSKVANVMMTRVLAEALKKRGVTVNALHPGVIDTKLLHVLYSGGAPTEAGARTSVYLATSDQVAGTTGRYFSDGRERRSWVLTAPAEESHRMWQWTVQELKDSVDLDESTVLD